MRNGQHMRQLSRRSASGRFMRPNHPNGDARLYERRTKRPMPTKLWCLHCSARSLSATVAPVKSPTSDASKRASRNRLLPSYRPSRMLFEFRWTLRVCKPELLPDRIRRHIPRRSVAVRTRRLHCDAGVAERRVGLFYTRTASTGAPTLTPALSSSARASSSSSGASTCSTTTIATAANATAAGAAPVRACSTLEPAPLLP